MKTPYSMIAVCSVALISGCASTDLPQWLQPQTAPTQEEAAVTEPVTDVVDELEVEEPQEETLDPTPPPPPPPTANTAEELDTTTAEDKADAADVTEPVAEAPLGTTLATLGDPTDPGFWLKTPFVSSLTPGRIKYKDETINVDLRPSGGEAGSGSQISLAAMQLLGASLTEIIEVTVFEGQPE